MSINNIFIIKTIISIQNKSIHSTCCIILANVFFYLAVSYETRKRFNVFIILWNIIFIIWWNRCTYTLSQFIVIRGHWLFRGCMFACFFVICYLFCLLKCVTILGSDCQSLWLGSRESTAEVFAHWSCEDLVGQRPTGHYLQCPRIPPRAASRSPTEPPGQVHCCLSGCGPAY